MPPTFPTIAPSLFLGGQVEDYVVEVSSGGGLGTRHLLSGKYLPHVRSLVLPETLKKGLSVGTALEAAQPWLVAANLGVGLLNLGVGTWTAWKVHKMSRQQEELAGNIRQIDDKLNRLGASLEASTNHLDHLIRDNTLLLGVLHERQGKLDHDITRLREEVARGFRSVHEMITSVEARREAKELEDQMRLLFRDYTLCTHELRAGRLPPIHDLHRILDTASKLIAWLDTRINSLPVGHSARMPFLVARAFALRLEVEARRLLNEAPEGRSSEFTNLQRVIRDEVTALTRDASLFSLAEGNRLLIEQYIFLHRAIRSPATMIDFPDGRVEPYYPQNLLTWNDQLDPVRRALQEGGSAPERFELKTLTEHRALQRLVGLSLPADDIETNELLRIVGIPETQTISEQGLRSLLQVGPSAVERARNQIQREVG